MGMIIQMGRFAPPPGVATAQGFDFYIGPSGSNANDGLTPATPWAISALSSKPQIAGKRIGVLDGTYRIPYTSGSGNNNDPLQAIAYGGPSAGVPTIIEGVNALGAVITTNNGSGVYPVDGSLSSTLPCFGCANNTTLRKLHFQDMAFFAVSAFASNVIIDSCEINDIVYARTTFGTNDPGDNCGGIMVGGNHQGLRVTNCKIHDIYDHGTTAITNNGCIGPLYDYANIQIDNCTMYNSGHAIGPKRNVGRVYAYQNYIRSMQAYAIRSMTDEDPSQVSLGGTFTNNVITDIGNLYGSDNPQVGMLPRSTVFAGNTVVFNANIVSTSGGILHWNGPANTSGIATANQYYNNIFFVPTAVAVPSNGFFFFYTGTNNRAVDRIGLSNYNLFGQTLGKFKMVDSTGTYTTPAAWTSATGFDSASLTGDPAFVSAAGVSSAADLKLNNGSPAIGAGKVGGVIAGAAVTIGAWDGIVATIGCNF